MGRTAVGVIVLVTGVALAQIRLSRGEPHLSEPPPLDLWADARPAGRPSPDPVVTHNAGAFTVSYPDPWSNCVTLVSGDPASRFTLTAVDAGAMFDIDGDGDLDRVAWTEAGTDVAFLAIDRNNDRRITSGRELIGDHTLPDASSGVLALQRLASARADRRGEIDSDHPVFRELLLWQDTNHNGISEDDELRRADQVFATIGLGYGTHRRVDGRGNQSRFRGFVHVRTAPGTNAPKSADEDRTRRRDLYDVCLAVQ